MIPMFSMAKPMTGWLLSVVLFLLSGCGTSPSTNFYSLTAAQDSNVALKPAGGRIVVGVGPVEVAPYLERSQMVLRSGRNGVELSEFDQWIEPMESNIENALVANLAGLLPAIHPIARPWPEADARYHVFVRVQQFDSDRDGRVILHAHWGILVDEPESMPVIKESIVRQGAAGPDYEAIVGAMSVALSDLSAEIAAELESVLENTAG